MNAPRIQTCTLLLALLASASVQARGVYQAPEAFLDEAFDGATPAPQLVWLRKEVRETTDRILGHRYPALRIRYWRDNGRSAWILDEIGKERPITTGIVVEAGAVDRIRVLEYRESRGGEVRHAFFTDQFRGAALARDYHLDRNIDGISGATLSVRALKKLAALALYLHDITGTRDDQKPQ